VVEDPARRLGAAVADTRPRPALHRRLVGLLVPGDQPERLVGRVDELHGAHDDAAERVALRGGEPHALGGLAGERGQPVVAEREAPERTAEVGAAADAPRVERVRPLDVLLDEVIVVLGDVDVQAARGDDAAGVDRVLVRLRQRHELVVALVVGEVEARGDAHRLERDLPRALERLHELCELALARHAVPAADAYVDRMDLTTPDDRHHPVPCLLELERAGDEVGVVAGELDRALVAEEVGRVEHVDVQRVALDPLAAVEETPQRLELTTDLDAADLLHRMTGAHLVRDRADAADPRGDVRRLREAAAAQEGLEEARRLVDVEFDVGDATVLDHDPHGALALHAGEVVGRDDAGPARH
jgi:hypothetical protein